MCGIFFCNHVPVHNSIDIYRSFITLSHRGPDSSSIQFKNNCLYGFHRLGIIHPHTDYNQPFTKNNVVLLCNGEIYNYKQLLRTYFPKISETDLKSDCEIILHLYFLFNKDFTRVVQALDGEFAIILHDTEKNTVYCARDFMGIRPLYYNYENHQLRIASEIKALPANNSTKHILPRKIYAFHETETITDYWSFEHNIDCKHNYNQILENIYQLLTNSVKLRVHSERPIGCLLSGGLDSSIIVSLVSKIYPNVQCFTVGAEDSPDVQSAKLVAEYLKVPLHIVPFNYEQGFQSIPQVIQALETYDITTVRASTPQFLIAKYISENTDIKVVLSGEGSDELFSGYIYSKLAPNKEELYRDGVRLLNELYLFDCLRTDRTMSNWGLEVRVPFLNKSLVDYVLNVDPILRMCTNKPEKALLRAVALRYKLLPDEIIHRRKEAFSDAVSNHTRKDSWIQYIQSQINTSEKDYYYSIYKQYYSDASVFSHYWMPKWSEADDPSATVLNIY